jgi:alpha-glucosidase (family GH31 glycosyl hydrolase)
MRLLKPASRRNALCAVLVFLAAHLANTPANAAAIPVQSVAATADGVTLGMSPGTLRLTVCSDSIVRVMYSPTAALPAGQDFVVTNHSWPAVPFKVADRRGQLTITTRKLKVSVDKASGAVAFYDAAGGRLLAEPATGGKTMTAVTVNGEASFQPEQVFTSPAGEFLYGLGQFQEGIWNWRGLPQELRQLNTQIALPMIVSSCGYGLLWNNAALTEFNPADTALALTNGAGAFTTTDAGDYVFFVKKRRPPQSDWRAGQWANGGSHHEHVGALHPGREHHAAGPHDLFRAAARRRAGGQNLRPSPGRHDHVSLGSRRRD